MSWSRWFIVCVVVVVASSTLIPPPALTRGQDQPPTTQPDIIMQRDIVYGRAGDVELKLNLSRPRAHEDRLPCVIVIHGGAWRSGDRGGMHDALINTLARRGYVAVSISYRFAPEHRFPAQIEDAKCAVRYLRAHADELKIDPDRIGAMGFSAGAHLAMLLGTMDSKDGLEGNGGWRDQSSKVRAVVAFFGPTDLLQPIPPQAMRLVEDFIGGTQESMRDQYRRASPITYVDTGDAPMLLFHGTADPLVPWNQAVSMAEALHQAGVPGRVELLIGKGHGWLDEDLTRTLDQSWAFFDRWLK